MTFDPKLPCRYRNGEPARILCTDAPDKDWPIISMMPDGGPLIHGPDGALYDDCKDSHDLINTKPRIKGWVIAYQVLSRVTFSELYEDEEQAHRERRADLRKMDGVGWGVGLVAIDFERDG